MVDGVILNRKLDELSQPSKTIIVQSLDLVVR